MMSLQKQGSLGSILVLAVIACVVCYKTGFNKGEAGLKSAQEQLSQLGTEKIHLQQQLKMTQQNYHIQVEAKKNLTNHLRSLQETNSELTENIDLYQTVSGKSDLVAVQMKAFQIYPTNTPQTFRYSIVLSNLDPARTSIHGAVSLVIVGNVGEKILFLPVKYVNSGSKEGLPFQFQHLQELSGELTLPPTFVAKEVLVKAQFENGIEQLERSFPWTVTG